MRDECDVKTSCFVIYITQATCTARLTKVKLCAFSYCTWQRKEPGKKEKSKITILLGASNLNSV